MSTLLHSETARRWRGLFYVALAITLVLLLTPGDVLLQAKIWVASWLPGSRLIDALDATANADKVVHFALFAVLSWLAAKVWLGQPVLMKVLLGLVVLGAGTELAQHFIPGRGASVLDFLTDALGVYLGYALQARWQRAATD